MIKVLLSENNSVFGANGNRYMYFSPKYRQYELASLQLNLNLNSKNVIIYYDPCHQSHVQK